MNYWLRFWVVVLALMTGVSALGYLFLSFVFPDAVPVATDSVGRLAVVLVGAVAIAVVVWGATTFGEETVEPPGRRE